LRSSACRRPRRPGPGRRALAAAPGRGPFRRRQPRPLRDRRLELPAGADRRRPAAERPRRGRDRPHPPPPRPAPPVARGPAAPPRGRGGGTSLAGQCTNVAVVVDFSRHMNRVLALDPEARAARVGPGTVLDDLRDQAERHGLTFGPDPASHNRCTLGGMIGNNSCGVHSVMAGKTVDNVAELDVLTYDGLRLRVGPTSEEELARYIHG